MLCDRHPNPSRRRHRARCGPRRHAQEQVAAQLRDPTFQFSNKVNELVYGACYFFEPFTLADLRRVDPALACRHFSDAYANPADFHLCLTGAIEVCTGLGGAGAPVCRGLLRWRAAVVAVGDCTASSACLMPGGSL